MGMSDSAAQVFDITKERALEAKARSGLAFAFAASSVLVLLLGSWIGASGARDIVSKPLDSAARPIAIIGVTLMLEGVAVFLAFGARINLPGARAVRVDPTGIELVFGPSKTTAFGWGPGARSFQLLDYSKVPMRITWGRAWFVLGPHLFSRPSCISQEAFTATLCAAESGGASIKTIQPSPYVGDGAVTYRISTPRFAPPAVTNSRARD